MQDAVGHRADVANNLSITRPLLVQKQTKLSASDDRRNAHLGVIEQRHGCFAYGRRFIPITDVDGSGAAPAVSSMHYVCYPVCYGHLHWPYIGTK